MNPHRAWDHGGYLSRCTVLTDGQGSGLDAARPFRFCPGVTPVVDCGAADDDGWLLLACATVTSSPN